MAKKLDLALVVRAVDEATKPLGRIQKAIGGLKGASRAVGRAAVVAGRGLRRVGVLGAAAGVAGAVFGQKYATAADNIAKTADKLGLGVVELQKLRYVADRAGVSTTTFDMAMQRFTRRAAEAAVGTGEAKDALAQLGLELHDVNGNLRPSGDLLHEVGDAMMQIDDPAERLRIAFKLFDSEGVKMVNMLSDGSGPMREIGDEMDDLGYITEEGARDAEKYIDAQTRMTRTLSGFAAVLGEKLIPALTPMIEKFTEFLSENKVEIIEGIVAAFEGLAAAVEAVASGNPRHF